MIRRTTLQKPFTLCALALILSTHAYGQTKTEKVELSLFPDKPVEVLGIQVTWKTDASSSPENPGAVIFEASEDHYQFSLEEDELLFYLNGVSLVVRPPRENSLWLVAWKSGSFDWDASPRDSVEVWVSQASPVTVGECRISVAEEFERMRDGTRVPVVILSHVTTGSEERLPAVRDTRVHFGRFTVGVTSAHHNTNTVVLRISAEPDTSVRGAGAYFKGSDLAGLEGKPLKVFLSELGNRYGFEISWSLPEELSEWRKVWEANDMYSRNLYGSRSVNLSNIEGLVRELVDRFEEPLPHLDFTWTDNDHLVISAKNPEELLAEREHEKKVAEETERLKKVLETDYDFQAQVFSLRTLDAETAEKLIEPKLATYTLLISSSTNNGIPLILTEDQINQMRIGGRKIDSKAEKVIADQRSNSLIVVARPETQKRVANILLNMDRIQEATEKSAPTFFRVEAVLLRGVEAGKNRASIADASFQGLDTKVESLQVADQSIRDIAALLSEYSNTNINVSDRVEFKVRTNLNIQNAMTVRQVLRLLEELYDSIQVVVGKDSVLILPRGAGTEPHKIGDPSNYGISEEDLAPFGVQAVEEVGKGSLQVVDEVGETGSASILLGDSYQVKLQYVDTRDPYLIVRGGVSRQQVKGEALPLVESTLFLKPGEPSLLGVTNLREALMLVVTLKGE